MAREEITGYQISTTNPREIRIPGSERIFDRNKILLVILVPLLMTLMQISSVNNILPTMQSALSASTSQLQWVLSGYALSLGITLVPAGRIGDLFGRSSTYIVGLIIFTFASLLVGLSTTPLQLNVLRFVQGFGSGVLSPQTTGLIQQYFAGRARAKAFALFGLVIAMSVAIGPLFSGWLVSFFGESLGWRLSFILNAPIGVIGIIFGLLWLPFGTERNHFQEEKHGAKPGKKRGEKRRNRSAHPKIDLDPLGMLLLSLAVLSIMLPFMIKAGPEKWLIVLGGFALMALWVLWENWYKKRGRTPMVDLDLFRIPTFSYAMGISVFQFLGTTSIFVIFAVFLQGIGASALTVGMVTFPNAVCSGVGALWAGKYAYDHGRGIQVGALSLIVLGILGIIGTTWAVQSGISYWWLAVPLCLLGFGTGCMGSANQTQAMLDVPPAHGGTAGGVMQTGQRLATAIGNAIITAVFFSLAGAGKRSALPELYRGITASYLVVAAMVTAGLILAIIFWRKGNAKQK
ncbi:MAG: MFS transporter [Actinomycetaceae bacterium]|nr:MFS transporter [Actinomycetaceae bacterium]